MEPKILNMKNEGAIILGSYGKTEKNGAKQKPWD